MGTLPNTDDVELQAPREILPSGKYLVEIEQSEIVDKENGMLFRFNVVVLDGDYENRKVFDNFWLEHRNPKAGEIGKRKLKQIKHAIGKPDCEQEEDLWGCPLVAHIDVEEGTNGYSDKNRIQGFSQADGSKPSVAKTSAPKPAAKPAAKPNGSAKPWEKKKPVPTSLEDDEIPF